MYHIPVTYYTYTYNIHTKVTCICVYNPKK